MYVIIPPDWLKQEDQSAFTQQLNCTFDELLEYNSKGYNCYFYPNGVSNPEGITTFLKGSDIDVFSFVFVDMDEKDGVWTSNVFIEELLRPDRPEPSFIIHSGRGIHAYWSVKDLDAMSYLKLQRRLCRMYKTDDAVCKIKQLMRVPGTMNTKQQAHFIPCATVHEVDVLYTCADLDSALPPLSFNDTQYCQDHYNRTYNVENKNLSVNDQLPEKFCKLLSQNTEVKSIWMGGVDDRSKSDWRLGHIMYASGFTRDEAMSVLVNSSKAIARSPQHRVGYAEGIVDKIWTFELEPNNKDLSLSSSVLDILHKYGDEIKGTRFRCFSYLDNTVHGFRLGQVLGLVAGVGVGKTSVALNMFYGFVQSNPDYDHMFVSLEQPDSEIADRWKLLCGGDTRLHSKVHVISNYAADGSYRNLSLTEIKDYILKFQETSGRKVGCVVIDHIGVLKKTSKEGRQSIEDICHQMKAFARHTNTFLVMQSQAPREKAGIGDLELNKDAAYGTVFFESYLDYLITCWQPLKRSYDQENCPRVTAFKFCKIRHKSPGDVIQEDVRYRALFNATTGHLRAMTQVDETAFDFFNSKCANLRKQDRKTEIVPYVSVRTTGESKTAEEVA